MSQTTDQITDPTTKDPVCGMSVTPATSIASAQHEGSTYHFCSEDCFRTFEADPSAYV